MKIRSGFVSNSSSSSFIVNKKFLSENDIKTIKEHDKAAGEDSWYISEDENFLMGDTIIDNFSMIQYLRENNINTTHFKFEW